MGGSFGVGGLDYFCGSVKLGGRDDLGGSFRAGCEFLWVAGLRMEIRQLGMAAPRLWVRLLWRQFQGLGGD